MQFHRFDSPNIGPYLEENEWGESERVMSHALNCECGRLTRQVGRTITFVYVSWRSLLGDAAGGEGKLFPKMYDGVEMPGIFPR